MGAASTAVGGLFGTYGDLRGRKQARRNLKYQKEQVERGYGMAEDQLSALFGEDGAVPTQYEGAREALRTGAEQAGTTIQEGFSQAGDVARTGMRGAMERLDPYAQQGTEAFTTYNQALQGGEGAADALSQFQESTGYGFLQDEMQRATQRQFAAQGKAGSGNVLAALQERSAGLASQSFNDFMSRLEGSAEMGLQASGTQAGMQQGLTQYLADLETGGATAQAGIQQGLGSGLADLGVSQASLESQVRGGAMQGGFGMAQAALGGTIQAGSERAQYEQAPWHTFGSSMASGGQQGWNEFMQIAPMMMGMSDRRLKTNVEVIGKAPDGLNIYRFDPTEEGEKLGMDYTVGFMADEVEELYPNMVHEVNGYKAVDYEEWRKVNG